MEIKLYHFAKVAQLVEHNLAKVRVAGSNPVFRSKTKPYSEYGFSSGFFVPIKDKVVAFYLIGKRA